MQQIDIDNRIHNVIEITDNTKAIIVQFNEPLSESAMRNATESFKSIINSLGIEVVILDKDAKITELRQITHDDQMRALGDDKRNLAFYKRSCEPWTQGEYNNIMRLVGNNVYTLYHTNPKYIFDDGTGTYHTWQLGYHTEQFNRCRKVAYEDIFND